MVDPSITSPKARDIEAILSQISSAMPSCAGRTGAFNSIISYLANVPSSWASGSLFAISLAALQACGGGGLSKSSSSIDGRASFITTSDGNDVLNYEGQEQGIEFVLLGGSDTLSATQFNDTIDAGSGNDTIRANGGDDVVVGGAGNDALDGGAGNDTLNGGAGGDILYGGSGSDNISGGAGDDIIIIIGITGPSQYELSDIVAPRGFNAYDVSSLIDLDMLNNNTIDDAQIGEVINGGSGTDTLLIYGTTDLTNVTISDDITQLVINSDVTLRASQLDKFTIIVGGTEGDNLPVIRVALDADSTQSSFTLPPIQYNDTFQTRVTLDLMENVTADIDSLERFNNTVSIVGGKGTINFTNDILSDGSINNSFLGQEIIVQETALASDGTSTVTSRDASIVANGRIITLNEAQNVTALGGLNIDLSNENTILNLSSGGDNVMLASRHTHLIINSDAGDDVIALGRGDNYIESGTGNDTISTLSGRDSINAGDGDDVITSGDGADQISGDAGNDTINAEAGNDTIDGGLGDDEILAGDGDDFVTSLLGNNTVDGEAGSDNIVTGDGNDVIKGGAGDDVIRAGAGADTVEAGAGNDLIVVVGDTSLESYNFNNLKITYDHDGLSGTADIDVDLDTNNILAGSDITGSTQITTSEYIIGEVIDGGDGHDTLIIYGEVVLNDAAGSIDNLRNIETIILNSDLTLTTEALLALNAAGIELEGGVDSIVRISASNDSDNVIAQSDLSFISNIGALEIQENVRLDVAVASNLGTIFASANQQISGQGELSLNVGSLSDITPSGGVNFSNILIDDSITIHASDGASDIILDDAARLGANINNFSQVQTDGADIITGTNLNDIFTLGSGEDVFRGGLGRDTYIGTINQFGRHDVASVTIDDFAPGDALIITDNNTGSATITRETGGVVRFLFSDGDLMSLDLNGALNTDFPITRLHIGTNEEGQTLITYNEAPVFGDDININVTENGDTSAVIVTSQAADDNTLIYSLEGDDAAFFQLTSVSEPSIKFADGFTPDFENPQDANGDNIYNVILTAREVLSTVEEVFSVSQNINVRVENFNEDGVFTSADNFTLLENSSANSLIFTATVEDAEGGTISYSLSGDDAALFDIDSTNGNVISKQKFDFEAPSDMNGDNIFNITVRGTVNDGLITQTSEQNVIINLSNTDEVPTINTPDVVLVNENILSDILTIDAFDPDASTILNYSITGGLDQSLFTINSLSGVVNSTSVFDFEAPIDSNTDGVYNIEVSVTDNVDGHEQTKTVNLIVQNIQEIPVYVNPNISLSIAEGLSTTQVYYTSAADDQDAIDDVLSYSLAGKDSALFRIDPTGRIFANQDLDYEQPIDTDGNNTYFLEVTTQDTVGNEATQNIEIIIQDVNEAPINPSIAQSYIESGIDLTGGLVVGELLADDPEGLPVSFNVQGGVDSALFSIVSGNLIITNSAVSLARESFDVTIRASDSAFNITDFDLSIFVGGFERLPTGTEPVFASRIEENTNGVDIIIGNLDIVPGTFEESSILYEVIGGDSGFSINSASGELTFSGSLDFETSATTSVTVQATATDIGQNITRTLVFDVVDTNDAPLFLVDTVEILSSEGSTDVFTQSIAQDNDAEDTLIYILTGDDAGLLTIDSSTGDLSFNDEQDFESPADSDGDGIYHVNVLAIDSHNASAEQSYVIRLTNINEEQTSISIDTMNVDENAAIGTVVGMIMVDDSDSPLTPFGQQTIRILEGASVSTNFDVNIAVNDDGSLRYELVVTNADIDFETDTAIDIVIEAIDNNNTGFSYRENVTITINNADEVPFFADPTTQNISIIENDPAVIYTAVATDPESIAITYSLSGADAALFMIDATTGDIQANSTLDFEAKDDFDENNIYNITVIASDGVTTTEQDVNITVTNEDEPLIFNINHSMLDYVPNYSTAHHLINNVTSSVSDSDISNIYEPGIAAGWTLGLTITDTGGFAIAGTHRIVYVDETLQPQTLTTLSVPDSGGDNFVGFLRNINVNRVETTSSLNGTFTFGDDATFDDITRLVERLRYDVGTAASTEIIELKFTITDDAGVTTSETITIANTTGPAGDIGTAGDDYFYPTDAAETFLGNGGADTIFYNASTGAVTVDLTDGGTALSSTNPLADGDTLTNINTIYATNNDDTLSSTVDATATGTYTFHGGGGADTITGGVNTTDFSSYDLSNDGVVVNLDTNIHTGGDAEGDMLTSIEGVIGSRLDDTITGSSNDDILDGFFGDDVIDGGAGADTISGSGGDDVITGGSGDDVFEYMLQLNEERANDIITDGHDIYTDFGADGNDIFRFQDNMAGTSTASNLDEFLENNNVNSRIVLSGMQGDANNDNIVIIFSGSDGSGSNATVRFDAGVVGVNTFSDVNDITFNELETYFASARFEFE